jgi:hypothetical protein
MHERLIWQSEPLKWSDGCAQVDAPLPICGQMMCREVDAIAAATAAPQKHYNQLVC